MKNGIAKTLLFTFLVLFFLFVILQSHFYIFRATPEITKSQQREIVQLAAEALKTSDVPVGALLLYDDDIIGKGFNTVNKDRNVAGHAEINAINDAVQTMGMEKFKRLNRDKLILVSSFEPCEMCKGTMLHYNIKKVYFMKDKSLLHWIKNGYKSFRYEWKKKKIEGAQLQDSLFMLHPDYPGKKD
ncbi:MAG: nucleoside deaminase [Bacteroidales bacterium]|nr:nucleoside deaminase [Bacteroidales bacterium]